ncbi:DUF4385 family protein, partial [Salmonella enterica]|uniref:DUF4385 family protein n=1 Tax=Salmonella enterica TaxID=28901 RepID=UPI0021AC71AC
MCNKKKDKASAMKSAEQIYQCVRCVREQDEFVSMDRSRKIIQKVDARARRFANYKGCKKYAQDGGVNTRRY